MIRFIASDDKQQFIEMYHNYLDDLSKYSVSVTQETDEWIDNNYFSNILLENLFIRAGDQTIGFIVLQYVDQKCNINPPLWYIVEFYIRPEYRGRGYGTKAIELFLQKYTGSFFYYILKNNNPAKKFWKHITVTFNLNEVSRTDVINESPELETHTFQRS